MDQFRNRNRGDEYLVLLDTPSLAAILEYGPSPARVNLDQLAPIVNLAHARQERFRQGPDSTLSRVQK